MSTPIFTMINKRCMFTGHVPRKVRDLYDKYLMGQVLHTEVQKKTKLKKHQLVKVFDFLTAEKMMLHNQSRNTNLLYPEQP